MRNPPWFRDVKNKKLCFQKDGSQRRESSFSEILENRSRPRAGIFRPADKANSCFVSMWRLTDCQPFDRLLSSADVFEAPQASSILTIFRRSFREGFFLHGRPRVWSAPSCF